VSHLNILPRWCPFPNLHRAVAVIALAGSALAQTAHKVVRVEDVKWTDHPIFKGAKTAILVGDPTKAEVIVQRVKFPPHYRVPPNTHPYAEVVTVLSGSYGNNFGEKFEPKDLNRAIRAPSGHYHRRRACRVWQQRRLMRLVAVHVHVSRVRGGTRLFAYRNHDVSVRCALPHDKRSAVVGIG